MVVAARAADGDAEECRAHDVRHLGEDFVLRTGYILVAGVLAERAEAVETAGYEEACCSVLSISSPASCSLTNWSYGLSSLKLWTT